MKIVPSEEYRVERTVLTTRVFRGGQGRLDPTPDVPSPPSNPQASTRCGESRRVRATMRTSLVYGLFTDEVQDHPGGH